MVSQRGCWRTDGSYWGVKAAAFLSKPRLKGFSRLGNPCGMLLIVILYIVCFVSAVVAAYAAIPGTSLYGMRRMISDDKTFILMLAGGL